MAAVPPGRRPTGFSQKMCLPAAAAATASSWCSAVGSGDVDDVDVVAFEQLVPVGGAGLEAEVVDGQVDALGDVVGDRNQLGSSPVSGK